MNYRGHLTVGTVFFLAAYATLLFALHIRVSVADALLGLALCEFGALAPDLDHKSSKIHRWSYAGSAFAGVAVFLALSLKTHDFISAGVLASIVAGILALVVFLLSNLKHRGFTHHAPGFLLFVLCIFLAMSFLRNSSFLPLPSILDFSPAKVTIFGAIGYLSHLIADAF